MMFVITPPKAAGIPVRGSDGFFPVHRIYCVGRNYAAHTIEMGHDPDREDPFFFQNNPDNLVTGGGAFPYPPRSNDVHHDIELTVALGKGAKDIPHLGQAAVRTRVRQNVNISVVAHSYNNTHTLQTDTNTSLT